MAQLAQPQTQIMPRTRIRWSVVIASLVAVGAIAVVLIVALGDNGTYRSQGASLKSQPASNAPAARFDGGPNEGTRGAQSLTVKPSNGTRFDGGPDEGSAGVR